MAPNFCGLNFVIYSFVHQFLCYKPQCKFCAIQKHIFWRQKYLMWHLQTTDIYKKIQGAPRFELGTSWSAVKCSTTELYPHYNFHSSITSRVVCTSSYTLWLVSTARWKFPMKTFESHMIFDKLKLWKSLFH